MILIMRKNTDNQQVIGSIDEEIQYFPHAVLSKGKDKTLKLIDLGTDGWFQKRFSAEVLASYLIKNGLLPQVQCIDLIISDVDVDNNLVIFAQKLSNELAKSSNESRNITVRIPTELNYDATLLLPPSNLSSRWQVFGVKYFEKKLLRNHFSITDLLNQIPDKKLLWEGEKIEDWLTASPQRIFSPHPEFTGEE